MIRAALLAAFAGTLLIFDAEPGINWGIWITLVSIGILGARWMEHGRVGRPSVVLAALACAFAWGAAATAAEGAIVLCLMGCLTSLTFSVALAANASSTDLSIPRMLISPVAVPARSVIESVRRLEEGVVAAKREESLPVIRGVALTVPIVGVFGLALSAADPVFALWRDRTFSVLENFPLGELVFGTILFVGCLGVFGMSARAAMTSSGDLLPRMPALRLGSTERLIVLGSIAALFGCFLLLQISYLFGNAPAEQGSGVTFAEYARRGFFELAFVAAACGAFVALVRGDQGKTGDLRVVRALELTVIAQVVLMLVSAFRKMLLYEAAYGYTVQRIWVQGFMIVLAIALGALALEVRGSFDLHRLVRRGAVALATMVLAFTYWNDHAWIVEKNLDRYAESGQFDFAYIANGLSPDAIPSAMDAAREIGGTTGWCLERMVRARWTRRVDDGHWFEANVARADAHEALSRPLRALGGPRNENQMRKACLATLPVEMTTKQVGS